MRSITYFLIIVIFCFINCKSFNKITYDSVNTLSGNPKKEIESNDKIDNWKTYEIFFKLSSDEDCINIKMMAETYDEVSGKNIALKIFFIIDKAVDISRFNQEKKILFSELGRNYNFNWSARQNIDVCSIRNDPIKRLDKNNVFRIRFTAFKITNFLYNINIFSDSQIKIMDKNSLIK
ncbi:MAG: hypothetical protein V1874_03080 [Spirochaetota bacterium]